MTNYYNSRTCNISKYNQNTIINTNANSNNNNNVNFITNDINITYNNNNNNNNIYIVTGIKTNITITLPTISIKSFSNNNNIINYTIINNSCDIVYIKSDKNNLIFNSQLLPKIYKNINNNIFTLEKNRLCNLYINNNYEHNYVWLALLS